MSRDKEPETLDAFIKAFGLTMTAEHIDARPDKRDALTREVEADRESKARATLNSPSASYESKERARAILRQVEWERTASHWRCTFKRKDGKRSRSFVAYYSMGPAHTGEPETADVLDALASDARSGMETFASFCGDMGYDTDSRESERVWRACVETFRRLGAFLGSDGLARLHACEPL